MYLVVHNRSAVGFVVLHFVTIVLDLNVEYVFLWTCALRANFGRFVTADYLKKYFIFSASSFSFQRAHMGRRVGKISPPKCTVTVCLQNQNPNSAVKRVQVSYIRIAAEAVVRICALRNYIFNVCYLSVGVIWAVLYMIL